MKIPRPHRRSGFTLVELLVVIAVVAGLAAAAMAALRSARVRAAEMNDLTRLRNLGVAIHSWAADHHGRPPRSSHSATGHGELGWQREILPLLGQPDTSRDSLARAKSTQFGIDPEESPPRGPALNVYFELDPEYDDYEGAPKSWRNFTGVPNPAATVLLVTAYGTADHIMAQYLTGKALDLPAPRPGRKSGGVLWVDGHATLEARGSLYDPVSHADRFHPDKAR
jgi:prepilin-type N-terminal cleavage/methylation domain-containing protein